MRPEVLIFCVHLLRFNFLPHFDCCRSFVSIPPSPPHVVVRLLCCPPPPCRRPPAVSPPPSTPCRQRQPPLSLQVSRPILITLCFPISHGVHRGVGLLCSRVWIVVQHYDIYMLDSQFIHNEVSGKKLAHPDKTSHHSSV